MDLFYLGWIGRYAGGVTRTDVSHLYDVMYRDSVYLRAQRGHCSMVARIEHDDYRPILQVGTWKRYTSSELIKLESPQFGRGMFNARQPWRAARLGPRARLFCSCSCNHLNAGCSRNVSSFSTHRPLIAAAHAVDRTISRNDFLLINMTRTTFLSPLWSFRLLILTIVSTKLPQNPSAATFTSVKSGAWSDRLGRWGNQDGRLD